MHTSHTANGHLHTKHDACFTSDLSSHKHLKKKKMLCLAYQITRNALTLKDTYKNQTRWDMKTKKYLPNKVSPIQVVCKI